MNILILGSQPLRGCHIGENLLKSFTDLGYELDYLYAQILRDGLTQEEYNRYLQRKELYYISKALERLQRKPDLIIVDQIGFAWKNDVNIPVIYFHRFFKRTPIIDYPTVALFRHEAVITFFQKIFIPLWCDRVKELRVMPVAIDPNIFDITKEKTVKGISCLAGRENMATLGNRLELTAIGMIAVSNMEIKKFQDLGLNWIDDGTGLTDARYREILPTLEALWAHIPLGQYASRRFMEAMICKTVCIIKIENEFHEEILNKMGFIANEHYIKIDTIEEMVELNKNWNYGDYKDMIEKAYKIVLERHTFNSRAKELIQIYEGLIKNEA